jgi:hypothetical protein
MKAGTSVGLVIALLLTGIAAADTTAPPIEDKHHARGRPSRVVDARGLVAPLRARVRFRYRGGDGGGEEDHTLELTDNNGRTLTIDVGSSPSGAAEDELEGLIEPSEHEPMFELGSYWAGSGEYYQIRRRKDTIIIRHKTVEEQDSGPFEFVVEKIIKLPPKAQIR